MFEVYYAILIYFIQRIQPPFVLDSICDIGDECFNRAYHYFVAHERVSV